RKRGCTAVTAESRRHGGPRSSNFQIRGVNVLVTGKREKLVFDNRSADGCAGGVAMEFGHFFAGGNIGILIVEIRRGVQPIRSAVNISGAMKAIAARYGVHID